MTPEEQEQRKEQTMRHDGHTIAIERALDEAVSAHKSDPNATRAENLYRAAMDFAQAVRR